jgi:hypothetical protein
VSRVCFVMHFSLFLAIAKIAPIVAIISLPRIGRFRSLVVRRMVAFGEWSFGEWSPSEIGRSEIGRSENGRSENGRCTENYFGRMFPAHNTDKARGSHFITKSPFSRKIFKTKAISHHLHRQKTYSKLACSALLKRHNPGISVYTEAGILVYRPNFGRWLGTTID